MHTGGEGGDFVRFFAGISGARRRGDVPLPPDKIPSFSAAISGIRVIRMTRLTTLTLLVVLGSSSAAFAGPELTKAYILSILKDAKPDLDSCGAGLHGDVVKTHFVIETSGDVGD